MGCGSSRQVVAEDAIHDQSGTAVSSAGAPLATRNAFNQPPVTQSTGNLLSSASSRPQSPPLASADSARSSPRPSAVARRRHAGSSSGALSDHYNTPLLPPLAWRSRDRTWTPSQLQQERRDFFDSRVTGQREVWEALRQVAECVRDHDIPTAQTMLDAIAFTLPSGRLDEGGYDERGNLYRLPETVLSDPTNLLSEKNNVDGETVVGDTTDTLSKDIEVASRSKSPELDAADQNTLYKGKEAMVEDAIKIKCRMSDRGSDVIVAVGKSQPVRTLIARIGEEAQLPASLRVRIFYLGRELNEKITLEEQDFREGHVLNIFVAENPPP